MIAAAPDVARMRHCSLLIAAPALLAACATADRGADTSAVRDSAGVQIVESRGPSLESPWRIDPEPVVSIGVEEGAEPYQFSLIGHAFRLDDGRIVVSNQRNPAEIRVFDAQGTHLRTLGRSGSGPGEFTFRSFADRLGDTIRAYDPGQMRITHFSPDGELLGVAQIANVGGDPASRYILFPGASNGGLLGRSNAPRPDSTTSNPRRGFAEVILADPSGTARTQPMRIADGEYDESSSNNGLLLFTPRTGTLVKDSLLYVGTAADWTIDVYGPDLRLRRRIRRLVEPRPVTDADAAAYVEERVSVTRDPARRQAMERSFAGRAQRTHVPAYDMTMLVDAEGNLWVRSFPMPGQTEQSWSVFDGEGRYLGDVDVPASLQILTIERDHVLAVHRDELDVQRLQLLRLVK